MDDTWIRRLTALVVLVVAAFAGIVSYEHAYDLARTHGQFGVAARLLPLSIDGLIVSASLVLLHAARQKLSAPRLARWMLVVGVAATVGANLAYGLRYGILGGVISSWPAISFIGSVELVVGMIRRSRRVDEPEQTEVPIPLIHRTFSAEIANCEIPTVRAIKEAMQVGQPKATWVRDYLTLLAGN